MTRPQSRLPELAGMTEAGFNRVVAMIQDTDFHRGSCVPVWERGWFTSCPRCSDATANYLEWRTSLPKTRNKKQRKADAKRALVQPVDEWRAWTAQEIVDAMRRGIVEAREQTLKPYVPRVLPCSVCGRPTGGCCTVMAPPGTPLQRLMRFAAEDGTPVSFEIAEKAMKGEW